MSEWASGEGSEGCWVCRWGGGSQTSVCHLSLTLFYGYFIALAYCSRPDSLLQGSAPLVNPSPKASGGVSWHLTLLFPTPSPPPDYPLIHTRSNMSNPHFSLHCFKQAWHTLSHTHLSRLRPVNVMWDLSRCYSYFIHLYKLIIQSRLW